MKHTNSIEQNLVIEILSVSSVSAIALLFTICCYLWFKELQSCQFKQIMRILVMDLIYALIMVTICIAFLALPSDQPPLADTNQFLCYAEAYLSNFAILSSCAWTSLICHTLYSQIFYMDQKEYYYTYNIIGYFVPGLISFIPLSLGGYGEAYPMASTNCFYKSQLPYDEFTALIITCYYGPIWVIFIYNTIVMVLVVMRIRKLTMKASSSLYALFLYPAILAFCWVIPGIIQYIDVDTVGMAYAVQALCNSVGFLDAISYCYSEVFRRVEVSGCGLRLKEVQSRIDTCEINITVNTVTIQTIDTTQQLSL